MPPLNPVQWRTIDAKDDGQRVDNFIRKCYPQLPQSRIYQMVRKGEVRLNKKRITPATRIHAGDVLRLPPIAAETPETPHIPEYWRTRLRANLLYEDEAFLILNKPAGLAVHGGSGQELSLIAIARQLWPGVELAHRLDSATSGCLVLGKHRAALVAFQQAEVEKQYLCLVRGLWPQNRDTVRLKLEKNDNGGARVCPTGKTAITHFARLETFATLTLLRARLETGRTHQIRITTAHLGHPIVGDAKYGDFAFNRQYKTLGYRGMFLHAESIAFHFADRRIAAQAPLPEAEQALLTRLRKPQ